MNAQKIFGAVATLMVSLFVAGCASNGSEKAADGTTAIANTVTVTFISESQLRSEFGPTFTDNPFLTPAPTIFPKYVDFVVLRVDVASGSGTDLRISQAEAKDAKGKAHATFYDEEHFRELAKSLSSGLVNNTIRLQKIDWNYLPSRAVKVPRGKHSYVIVLVGKHPIPDDLTAKVSLTLDDTPQDFSIPIPNAE